MKIQQIQTAPKPEKSDAPSLEEKVKKYEDIILQLKIDNQQLEEDLNAAFERENDLQKALEIQRTSNVQKETEAQRQAKFDSINEIERLNETVFKKNREISEKIVEISNLNYKLTRQNEQFEEIQIAHEQENLYFRHKMAAFKLEFQKKISAKESFGTALGPIISKFSFRLLNLSQKLRIVVDGRKAEKRQLLNQIDQAKMEAMNLRRQKQALETKIEHLEQCSSKFKDEIAQLKTIHGMASINSQKELNSLRFSLKEFLEKHKQRIKTIKLNCEQFLANVFNRFSVLEYFGKKEQISKPDFDFFFENLKKVTSVKFSNTQKEIAEKKAKIIDISTGPIFEKKHISDAKVFPEINTKPESADEKPLCKNCQLLKSALSETEALIQEQQRFFDSQKRILTSKKNTVLEEKNNLKKLLRVNDEQHQAERQKLIEKLEIQQRKVLDMTDQIKTLAAESMDYKVLSQKLYSEVQRLSTSLGVLRKQKDETESKFKKTAEKIQNEAELKKKIEFLTADKNRTAGFLQELRSENAILKESANSDFEQINQFKNRENSLNSQLGQKEELIFALRNKLCKLEATLCCPKHDSDVNVSEVLKTRELSIKKTLIDDNGIRIQTKDKNSSKKDELPSCIACLKQKITEMMKQRSDSRQQQTSLSRKDEIIRNLQLKLEETENQTKIQSEEFENRIKKLLNQIKILEAENRKIGKQNLESTKDIETLKTCINELSQGFDRGFGKSEASPLKVSKHLAETCKILDLDVDDLDLFLDPKKSEKKLTRPGKSQFTGKSELTRLNDCDSIVVKCRDKMRKTMQ